MNLSRASMSRFRDELLTGLRDWLTRWKIPVLSQTHTLGEAFQLQAEVIKIADGRVVEQGLVETVPAKSASDQRGSFAQSDQLPS